MLVRFSSCLLVSALGFTSPSTSADTTTAHGQGVYFMGPDQPSVFTFDKNSLSCSVSWGTLGAATGGEVTSEEMGLKDANFGMIVFSTHIDSFETNDNRAVLTGDVISITTVNEKIVENTGYQFKAEALDGGEPSADRFTFTLTGEGKMFHQHTFEVDAEFGLISGDIVISD